MEDFSDFVMCHGFSDGDKMVLIAASLLCPEHMCLT